VGKNAKYRLSQLREDQFTAGTACRNTGNPGSNFFNPIIFLWNSRKDYTRNVRLDIEKNPHNCSLVFYITVRSPAFTDIDHGIDNYCQLGNKFRFKSRFPARKPPEISMNRSLFVTKWMMIDTTSSQSPVHNPDESSFVYR